MRKHMLPQEPLICTVCGTEFKPDDDTKYIIRGGYTCSWKCFLKEVKERETKKKIKKEDINNKK